MELVRPRICVCPATAAGAIGCPGRVNFLLSRLVRACVFGWLLVVLCAAMPAQAAQEGPGHVAPLQPLTVTRRFEPPPTPYAAGHRGVDLGGVPGERVTAAASGTVTFAGQVGGKPVVVVSHGELRTTYEPVRAIVRRGTAVAAGQQIGTLAPGHAGCPVPACLHWGLLRGDTYLDPLATLTPARVRLLPLAGDRVAYPASTEAAGSSPRSAMQTAAGSLQTAAGPAQVARLASSGTRTTSPTSSSWTVSPATWSLAALAAGGLILGRRRG